MNSGLLLLDKPAGITSHDLVARTRKGMGTKKVGHAGTLDPMATGLMILGVNQGTKLMQFVSGLDKTYLATIKLGSSTSTDDAEGEVTFSADASHIFESQLEQEMAKLRGEIDQVPSSVSAISIGGKRAHQLVREGVQVDIPARKVTVARFERIGDLQRADGSVSFDVVVDCSSGTYIRALARDLGATLGVGGHLTSLRRTRIGSFDVSDACEDPSQASVTGLADASALLMQTSEVSNQEAIDLGHGKRIAQQLSGVTAAICQGRLVAIVDGAGKIMVGFPQEQDA